MKQKLLEKLKEKAVFSVQDVASNIVIPSYISFWSASYYYGFTEQILVTMYIASTRRVKNFKALGYKIKFVKISNFFGYHKIKTNNGEMFIADHEKLLIDALQNQKQMGNFDEIIKVVQEGNFSKEKI